MPETWEMEQRRYSIAGEGLPPPSRGMIHSTSEDLHAWSIYRQNLNSDFTDSALGSSEKSPLPYGNFQLRESTVQSILNHPRYGPKSPLGANMYTYLKFGLPRVFPPKEGGNSSGYNSSNEGGGNNGGPNMPHMRKHSRMAAPPHRSTSEADFTHLQYRHPAMGHGKSLSQADLLSAETIMRQAAASHRRSLHDLRHTDYLHQALLRQPSQPHYHSQHHIHNHYPQRHHPSHQSQRTRRSSAAVTAQAQPPPRMEPFSFSTLHPQQYSGLYPHIQLRNMNVRNRKGEPMVNNLSTEVKAGEILSIMATDCNVGTCILETLAGRHPYSGQILLNGLQVGSKELRRVAAIVRKTTALHGDLTVSGTLRYYASLRRPSVDSRGKLSSVDQVAIVTDELGLSPVLDTRVSELTPSEESRLIVALQLLSDPQLLLVDDVTQPMDIFDAFFLVEFLRYWAAGATGGVTGRIVIMCLQPPTYEILTMVSRLVILSGSDTMYDGPSRALTHYFTPVQCPAPAFKNPADYYLDLVTLDDLSAEAMLESSQRVDQLAALYRRRQPPLTDVPPYTLPSPFSSLWFTSQAFILLLKDCFYSQPVSFSRWILRVIVAAVISVIVGSVFWDVPSSDPQLSREERLGFHFTILAVTSWPLTLTLGLARTHGRERQATESDIALGLYSRLVYIISTLIFSILPSSLVWLSYLIPAYCMSGLYDQSFSENLFIYIGHGLLCLLSLQWTCTAIGFTCPDKSWSILIYTIVHVVLSTSTGFPLFTTDSLAQLGPYNPLGLAYASIVANDHSPAVLRAVNSRLVCRNKQVQRQDIIVHLPCPVPNGTHALLSHGISPANGLDQSPSFLSMIWLLATSLIILIVFLVAPFLYKKSKSRKEIPRQ